MNQLTNKSAAVMLFVLLQASGFFAEGSLVRKTLKDRCSCKGFSPTQKQQLENILKGEAVHLRSKLRQMCGRPKTAKWTKVTSRPVCFGARDDEYGVITVPSEGFAAAMKLQHTSGYLTCNNSSKAYNSRWGCGTSGMSTNHLHSINTYITTAIDRVLFPQQDIIKDQAAGWYEVPGADSNSPALVFSEFSRPIYLAEKQQLRLWCGEDLLNHSEANNAGTSCAHVFIWYV